MKKIALLFGLMFTYSASAADITMYYSPSCPHCHHAREFIMGTLVYEFPELKLTMVDVTKAENRPEFRTAVENCGFESGGVPVLVIGEKCEQGYADFMQDDLRAAVSADLTAEQIAVAESNKKALAENPEKFKSEHAERANAMVEYTAPASDEKKNDITDGGLNWRFIGLIALVALAGLCLLRKGKTKQEKK